MNQPLEYIAKYDIILGQRKERREYKFKALNYEEADKKAQQYKSILRTDDFKEFINPEINLVSLERIV